MRSAYQLLIYGVVKTIPLLRIDTNQQMVQGWGNTKTGMLLFVNKPDRHVTHMHPLRFAYAHSILRSPNIIFDRCPKNKLKFSISLNYASFIFHFRICSSFMDKNSINCLIAWALLLNAWILFLITFTISANSLYDPLFDHWLY